MTILIGPCAQTSVFFFTSTQITAEDTDRAVRLIIYNNMCPKMFLTSLRTYCININFYGQSSKDFKAKYAFSWCCSKDIRLQIQPQKQPNF